jgi:hypothetical protein
MIHTGHGTYQYLTTWQNIVLAQIVQTGDSAVSTITITRPSSVKIKNNCFGGTFLGRMAFVAISRVRKANAKERNLDEDEEDPLPSYLSQFPDASARIKDLQLAVLLGR